MRSIVRTCLGLLSAALIASAATGQPVPAPASFYGDVGTPDISGLWLGSVTGIPGQDFDPNRGPADGKPGTYWTPWPLPYTPKYQKIWDDRVAAAKTGRALGDSSARCLPFGSPRMLVSKVYPDEIVQTPGQVTIFVNSTFPITIWTDGRPHPTDWKPSFNGHSIGYWVGDTLFVDTIGFNDIGVLDSMRSPHSTSMHLKWNIRRVAPDVLHFNILIDDPETFTEPVATTNIWRRKSGAAWQVLDDGSCFENNHTQTDEKAEPGFVKF